MAATDREGRSPRTLPGDYGAMPVDKSSALVSRWAPEERSTFFPERILVRAALTPERLEQLYQYKLEIRDARESPEWKRLLPLLRQTSVTASGRGYDHRTAVLFFDKNGRRIASVYLNQFGTGGTIDGKSGTISGGIYRWAKSLLKGVAA